MTARDLAKHATLARAGGPSAASGGRAKIVLVQHWRESTYILISCRSISQCELLQAALKRPSQVELPDHLLEWVGKGDTNTSDDQYENP